MQNLILYSIHAISTYLAFEYVPANQHVQYYNVILLFIVVRKHSKYMISEIWIYNSFHFITGHLEFSRNYSKV